MLVTIAPFDDVELTEGSTVGQLRPQLAAATGRPELCTAPLTVDGIRLEATQVCGHEPLLAGAIVHLGASRPDSARAAVRAPWHVAVIDGPDAGHLLAPGRDGSLVLTGAASLVDQPSEPAGQGTGASVRNLGDDRPTTVEVRVRASRLWTRVRWRTGHRRWHPWRAGCELAIDSSRFELRWRPDREPARWRRRRSGGNPQDRRRVRIAATTSSLVPLFSSVGLAIALHSATLLLIGLASVAALALTRRFDDHRTRDGNQRATPAAVGTATATPAAVGPGARRTATTSQPAELSRWLAGPPSEAVWRGPSAGLDLPPERCLGVVGPRERARSAVRAMITAAVARSEPGGLQVTVLGSGATAASWGWTRWLPTAVQLAAGGRLSALLDQARDLPVLCVADGPLSPRDTTALAGWWHQAAAGSSLILILDRAEDRPAWCHALLDVEAGTLVTADGVTRPVRTPGVSVAWAERTARRLLGRRTLLGAAGRRRRPVPLTGLAGLPRPEPASVGAAWIAHGTAGAPELRAPIGTTPDGRTLVLELSRDGPHVLIAGTTGAGKSELLQSLVISLAAQHSPAALTFALVDFKGGASLGPCVRLPHVTGRVSDLDPLLARRAVAGLRAELRRREAILAEAGVTDLDGLWRRAQSQSARSADAADAAGAAGSSDPGCAPPPRLVVVVDELRALVDDVPEAMPTIARIAAQGRALGIHLVLATQRPAGALSPDARANIGIRIALRVADPADSLDVLGIPDAAQIPHDRPGQALLRVAAATPVPFQTARVSGHAEDTALVRLVGAPPESGPSAECLSPDDAWVAAVSAAGERQRLPSTPPLWQPPLPEQVDLADLPDGSSSPDARSDALVWGLADLVDEQRQGPACWHPDAGNLLVVGRPGAGRTTALRTLAISALRSGREVHVISGSPARFADLSGCEGFGTIVAAIDGRPAHRLLELLHRGATPGRVPLLLLDDLPDLIRTLEARSRSAPDALGAVMRASGGAGLSIVASAAPDSLGRELSAYLPQRLILAASDATTALADGVPRALAGIPSRPGLGVWLGTQPAVLVQVAQARIEQSRPVAASIELPAIGPVRLRPLPADAGTPGVSRCAITAVPLGLGGDTAEPVLVDLSERGFLVVGPPRSGRSTTLAVLATALLQRCAEALIVSRRGPLLTLAPSSSQVRVTITDRPSTEQIARADLIVLDDLDDLERRDPDRCAEVCARSVAERSPGPIILASANTERASISFRGLLGELRRAGCGLVLGADAPGSKEVFMAPIDAHIDDYAGHPGRGVLLDRDGAVPLQVYRAP